MKTVDRAARNEAVAAARARGLSWSAVAQRFSLTERQCRRIVEDQRSAAADTDLAFEAVAVDTIAGLDAAIEDLALVSEQTDHASAKVGSIRLRAELFERPRGVGRLAQGIFQSPRQPDELPMMINPNTTTMTITRSRSTTWQR